MISQHANLALAVCLFVVTSHHTQANSLSGIVTNTQGEPLVGVMVTAKHNENHFGGVSITDANGNYLISELGDGEFLLVLKKQRFASVEIELLLDSENFIVQKVAMRRGLGFAMGSDTAPKNYSVINLHYTTDRTRTSDDEIGYDYTGARSGELEYGIARVAIPRDHRLGAFESPTIWKLEFSPNPNKHITLLQVSPGNSADLANAVRETQSALVFIHGFNVAFREAARRSAQLFYDLQFNGTPILYSWPSNGAVQNYLADESNAILSSAYFAEFIAHISGEVETLHVIAHSMGNQVLTRGLEILSQNDEIEFPIINEIALVAPDVDAELFEQSAESILPLGERTTLYVSANDKALVLSKQLRGGYPRLGDFDSQEGPMILPGLDTIDVSNLETDFLGHSYYGDNRSVISDLNNLLITGDHPSSRFGLQRVTFQQRVFWRFKP